MINNYFNDEISGIKYELKPMDKYTYCDSIKKQYIIYKQFKDEYKELIGDISMFIMIISYII